MAIGFIAQCECNVCRAARASRLATSGINDPTKWLDAPMTSGAIVKVPALTPADIQHAATEGCNTERDRILARLNAIKPGECSYTRIQSEWERKGAMRMWERMRDAIVDGKEAHKDRDALEGGE